MNRKPRILIVLVVAALTFGGLVKTVGKNHFPNRCCHSMEHCEKGNSSNCKTIDADKK